MVPIPGIAFPIRTLPKKVVPFHTSMHSYGNFLPKTYDSVTFVEQQKA
jgi:hypothetical protein